jgi:phytoene dehydrogenase-like protein
MGLPTVAIRPDIGSLATLGLRYPVSLIKTIIQGQALTRPFNLYYKELDIKDSFLKNYLNLLCFLLQGMPADGTLSAVMAYMMDDFYKPNAVMDFPKGGSGAIISALERGVLKNGGKVVRRATVEEILIENNKAVGVRVKKDGSKAAYNVKADTAVVTNTDLWSTMKLIPEGKSQSFDEERIKLSETVPLCKSFVHIHLGIDGKNLPDTIPPQWTVARTWDEPIDSPGNVIVVSMPTLLDPSMAPEGKHVIHAYTAGNEPYDIYEKFKNGNNKEEYEKFKEERAACLWAAIAKEIPDIKERTIVSLVGTPLTHERFNRRYKGTYGPALAAGNPFPGQTTPIKNLFRCGDSTNPGIGVPAVAASGAMAANAIIDLKDHWRLLNKIRM